MFKKRRMEYLCLLGAGILLLLLFAALIYLRDHFPKDIFEDDFFRIQQFPLFPGLISWRLPLSMLLSWACSCIQADDSGPWLPCLC